MGLAKNTIYVAFKKINLNRPHHLLPLFRLPPRKFPDPLHAPNSLQPPDLHAPNSLQNPVPLQALDCHNSHVYAAAVGPPTSHEPCRRHGYDEWDHVGSRYVANDFRQDHRSKGTPAEVTTYLADFLELWCVLVIPDFLLAKNVCSHS
ncbi:hypothetical protein V8E54_003053 [Elaphomyces granulatus]